MDLVHLKAWSNSDLKTNPSMLPWGLLISFSELDSLDILELQI
jgi:hypothetical protein